jgi:prolyl-tRNA editing enzyme YbaK/EbsC (Cys-tRNA(Pro) deacylase)
MSEELSEVSGLLDRIAALERAVQAIEEKTAHARVIGEIKRTKRDKNLCHTSRIVNVPENYYSLPLYERAKILSCSPPQLCKALLFEDSAAPPSSPNKFYLVIVQYVAKVSPEKLKEVVWRMLKSSSGNIHHAAPHLRVADAADSDNLTGFKHNAVSPFGLRKEFPVIIAKACVDVAFGYIYLGAGKYEIVGATRYCLIHMHTCFCRIGTH